MAQKGIDFQKVWAFSRLALYGVLGHENAQRTEEFWFLMIGYDISQTGPRFQVSHLSRQKHGRYICRVVCFSAVTSTLLGVWEEPWMLILFDLHFQASAYPGARSRLIAEYGLEPLCT